MNGLTDYSVVEVRLFGRTLGALAALHGKPGFYEFEYDPTFLASGLEPSPLHMPVQPRVRYSFPGLDPKTYYGLPGVIADALPDRFGNALIDEFLARHGIRPADVTTLQRLLYVGKRAMGALEFEPAMADTGHPSVVLPLEMASLVESARRALRGDTATVAQQIIDVGSSAGGARAKAVIGWNPGSQVVVSGQFELPEGYEHWILKFDVGDDRRLGHTAGFGRIEYAHARMAEAGGIAMSACRLLEENGRAHFMTRRFDRDGNAKIHMHSLCGLVHLDFNIPFVHSYEQYLRTVLELNLGAEALAQAWRRMVFNVAAVNCDDHTKNLAFLLDRSGRWTLAPAFDMCFAHNPGIDRWTRQHQMLVRGKAWDITGEDLIGIADDFDIMQPKIAMAEVVDAVRRWPEFAAEAGVPRESIDRIAALQTAACSRLGPRAIGSGRAR